LKKNGSDAIQDAEAIVSRSVMLMAKRLPKKSADTERTNGSDAGTVCRKEKK